jgi:hypothetical protein
MKFSAKTPKLLFLREYPTPSSDDAAGKEGTFNSEASGLCFLGVGVTKLISEARREDCVENSCGLDMAEDGTPEGSVVTMLDMEGMGANNSDCKREGRVQEISN